MRAVKGSLGHSPNEVKRIGGVSLDARSKGGLVTLV
jgi:hypothetical protein